MKQRTPHNNNRLYQMNEDVAGRKLLQVSNDKFPCDCQTFTNVAFHKYINKEQLEIIMLAPGQILKQ